MAATEWGINVVKLIDGQPPHKAGLRVGDVITGIDGCTQLQDVDQVRRLLRRTTAQDSTKFIIRRDGKSVDLTASFVGWEPPPRKP